MRRILHLVLAAFIAMLPTPSFGAGKYDASGSSSRKKKKKPKKTKAAEQEQENEAARAQGDEESQGSKRKKKRRSKTIEVAPDGTSTETTEGGEDGKSDAPKPDDAEGGTDKPKVTPAPAADDEEDDSDFEENPSKWVEALSKSVPPRRYAYVIGAIIGGTGLVFAYQAQGEAKRAETITSALEAQRAVNNARASAALANVLYGLAAAAVLLAVLLEFIPEPVAEKAALTFHF
jgi:hypothetical protein